MKAVILFFVAVSLLIDGSVFCGLICFWCAMTMGESS